MLIDAFSLLVAPRDPAALAVALERLLKDPVLRARLAEAAKEVSESFSLMTATEDMYLELLSGASPAPGLANTARQPNVRRRKEVGM